MWPSTIMMRSRQTSLTGCRSPTPTLPGLVGNPEGRDVGESSAWSLDTTRSDARAKGMFLIVAARCPVYGEPVCLDCSTYQNSYDCPLLTYPAREAVNIIEGYNSLPW